MVLEIPGGLFGQSDVRETATSDPTGTSYVSVPSSAFINQQPDTLDSRYADGTHTFISAVARNIYASIQIPNGAVVTGVVVYGNDTGNTWTLIQSSLSGSANAAMATAAVNTEDTSITNPTIDNSTNGYALKVATNQNDIIYGGRVTYTI